MSHNSCRLDSDAVRRSQRVPHVVPTTALTTFHTKTHSVDRCAIVFAGLCDATALSARRASEENTQSIRKPPRCSLSCMLYLYVRSNHLRIPVNRTDDVDDDDGDTSRHHKHGRTRRQLCAPLCTCAHAHVCILLHTERVSSRHGKKHIRLSKATCCWLAYQTKSVVYAYVSC